jgi:hypothetical protein
MKVQTYRNHRRFVILYHGLTLVLILILLVWSVVNLVRTCGDRHSSAPLLVLVALILASLYAYVRLFPLRAQDRAIRAEENLRHFILSGKPLDPQLTMQQIIALRFASDEEMVKLAKRAVDEALNNDEIKRAITNWRADHYRV